MVYIVQYAHFAMEKLCQPQSIGKIMVTSVKNGERSLTL